tara:strand:+ start:721 stop:960 length:240 start_codon:yes stop_codon:yes gene_type:complete
MTHFLLQNQLSHVSSRIGPLLKNSEMAYKLINTEFPDQNQTFIDSLESALWAVQKIKGSPGTIEDLIKEIEKAKALANK